MSAAGATAPRFSSHPQDLKLLFRHALAGVDPNRLVRQNITPAPGGVAIGKLTLTHGQLSRALLVAFGKASGSMTRAYLDATGVPPRAGLVAAPDAGQLQLPDHFLTFTSGHPLPNRASLQAGAAAEGLLGTAREGDLVIALISGGGSAMLELPVNGVTHADLLRVNEMLLRSGLPITAVNTVRSALSRFKAGGLARLAYPAKVISLILSDVVGDRMGSIASGPTVLQPDPRPSAATLLRAHGLWGSLPGQLRSALEKPASRGRARRPANILIGGNRHLVVGAEVAAQALGYRTQILSRQMRGEARDVGQAFARRLIRRASASGPPACLLMGGETTVRVSGSGRGGRNQELALAAAIALEGCPDIVIASLASDGIDGPTPAAGAIVHGGTAGLLRAAGIDPRQALARNDSHRGLAAIEALITTGPTGTNVADLVVGLIYPGR